VRGDGILIMITRQQSQHADCTNLRIVSLPDILHSSFSIPAYQSINQSTFKVAKDRRLKKPSSVPKSVTTNLSTSKIIQMYEKIQQYIYTVSRKKDPRHFQLQLQNASLDFKIFG